MRPLPASVSEALQRGGAGTNLLVLRLGALGDLLRTLPAVRGLRQALPHARLLWAIDDRWQAVLAGHPDLDALHVVPRTQWNAMLPRPSRWFELSRSILDCRRRLREQQVTLALDFHGNLRSGVLGRMSGAAVRVGFAGHQQKEGNRLWTTHHVASGARRVSRVERNLALVQALGIAVAAPQRLDLPLVTAGAGPASRLLAEAGLDSRPFAIVNPGASRAQGYKQPPPPLLAAASQRLLAHDVVPLLVWGPGEEPAARAVLAAGASAARLAPPTDLATLFGLLARARLFVGGDSGPLHMACAARCPVLGIYGPTDPEVNRPWGVPYRAVHPAGRRYTGIKRLDRRQGFEGLAPETVARALDDLLRQSARA